MLTDSNTEADALLSPTERRVRFLFVRTLIMLSQTKTGNATSPRRSHTARRRVLTTGALLLLFVVALVPVSIARDGAAQKNKPGAEKKGMAVAPQAPLLKRTMTRRETKRLGHGGTLTINGAPEGSITIEAWPKSEVEIVAEIEVSANTEEELAQLAAVNSFILESNFNHLRVNTVGTHDRKYMKNAARDFPKKLLSLPWKIDYRLRVPAVVDLVITTGSGPLTLTGVDGSVRLTTGGGASVLTLVGGDFEGTIASGPVNLRVPTRSWRGRGLTLRLISGDLTVELPAGFNGDVNADVLRTGRVENSHPGLAPREDDPPPTERSLHVRGGGGGAILSFTVVDGALRLTQTSNRQEQ